MSVVAGLKEDGDFRKMSMGAMIDRLTTGPARVLGQSYADLASMESGTPADIVLFDPEQEWTVDTSEFVSKGKNTPLAGAVLKGRVVATFASGNLVYQGPGLKIAEPHAKP